MLRFYEGKYVAALLDAFPDIGLDPSKFGKMHGMKRRIMERKRKEGETKGRLLLNFSVRFWEDPRNRRMEFTKLAHSRGFDPLIPTFWYSITCGSLRKYEKVVFICLLLLL